MNPEVGRDECPLLGGNLRRSHVKPAPHLINAASVEDGLARTSSLLPGLPKLVLPATEVTVMLNPGPQPGPVLHQRPVCEFFHVQPNDAAFGRQVGRTPLGLRRQIHDSSTALNPQRQPAK